MSFCLSYLRRFVSTDSACKTSAITDSRSARAQRFGIARRSARIGLAALVGLSLVTLLSIQLAAVATGTPASAGVSSFSNDPSIDSVTVYEGEMGEMFIKVTVSGMSGGGELIFEGVVSTTLQIPGNGTFDQSAGNTQGSGTVTLVSFDDMFASDPAPFTIL